MTIGDVFQDAVKRDLAGLNKGDLLYSEFVKDGKFEIKLSSKKDREAFIECSVPDKNTEEEKNYLRSYFLPMVGYEGLYQVSSFGRIKRLPRLDVINHFWPEIIIKSFFSHKYRRVGLF